MTNSNLQLIDTHAHLYMDDFIENLDKVIKVSGDKSISIRWVLISSLADGVSKAKNLLMSGDVLTTIKAIKKFGVKVIIKKILHDKR